MKKKSLTFLLVPLHINKLLIHKAILGAGV